MTTTLPAAITTLFRLTLEDYFDELEDRPELAGYVRKLATYEHPERPTLGDTLADYLNCATDMHGEGDTLDDALNYALHCLPLTTAVAFLRSSGHRQVADMIESAVIDGSRWMEHGGWVAYDGGGRQVATLFGPMERMWLRLEDGLLGD